MSYSQYATKDYRKELGLMYDTIKHLAQRYEIHPEYVFEDLYDKHLHDY